MKRTCYEVFAKGYNEETGDKVFWVISDNLSDVIASTVGTHCFIYPIDNVLDVDFDLPRQHDAFRAAMLEFE